MVMETGNTPLGQHWQKRHDTIRAGELADLWEKPEIIELSRGDPHYLFLLVIEEGRRRALEKDDLTDDARTTAQEAYQRAQAERTVYGVDEGYLAVPPDET
jgi:hypothetical protein